jgi:hypothetical protein
LTWEDSMQPNCVIPETIKVYLSDDVQQRLSILPKINYEDYKLLHKSYLTPTTIKIDNQHFINEIETFRDDFQIWGDGENPYMFSLSLVNYTGTIKTNPDPTNGSLTYWNIDHPENKFIDTDFRRQTEPMDLDSLKQLQVLDGHWVRSNILKWEAGGGFNPHVDAVVPSGWLRFWGTTSYDGFELSFFENDQWHTQTNVEPGRIYLIDTATVHIARKYSGTYNYQFFLAVDSNASDKIKKILLDPD